MPGVELELLLLERRVEAYAPARVRDHHQFVLAQQGLSGCGLVAVLLDDRRTQLNAREPDLGDLADRRVVVSLPRDRGVAELDLARGVDTQTGAEQCCCRRSS